MTGYYKQNTFIVSYMEHMCFILYSIIATYKEYICINEIPVCFFNKKEMWTNLIAFSLDNDIVITMLIAN